MPDGDIIHPTLDRRFLSVYAQICEGHWEASVLGYRVLHPLKVQIQKYGNVPIDLCQDILPILAEAQYRTQTGKGFIFADFSDQITELSKNQALNCIPRGRDIVVEAAKKTLFEIRNQRIQSSLDIESALAGNYVGAVYEKDFEDKIQKTPVHHKNVSHDVMSELICDIRPHIDRGRDEFAKQLVKHKDVSKLRRPRRLNQPVPMVDDDAW